MTHPTSVGQTNDGVSAKTIYEVETKRHNRSRDREGSQRIHLQKAPWSFDEKNGGGQAEKLFEYGTNEQRI
jgi:hypothetical protein